MRIPIASDGYRFIVPLFVLTVLFASTSQVWLAGLSALALLFVLNFFRDPERDVPNQENVVVSPADGKVVEIVEETDPLLGEPYQRISIFLNVFNVHVQRTPVAGEVEAVRYNKGKFLNAASHKASLDNEQNAMVIHTGKHKVLVKQIAGLIARRIVCWARKGDRLGLGERFGLIRFGSRVDLFLPKGARIDVKIGDHVKGACSVIGFMPGNDH
jgi:phosphatidylserine decarboxylase